MSDFSGSTIGERVELYRRLNGLTRDGLSDATGGVVGRDVLANIENGRRKDVTVSQLVAISTALQVPPTALLFDITRPLEPSGAPDVITGRSVSSGVESIEQRAMKVSEALSWYAFELDVDSLDGKLSAPATVARQVGAWRRYERALQGLDRNRAIFERGDTDIREQYGATVEHAWDAYDWAIEMGIEGLIEPPVGREYARDNLRRADG